MTNTDYRKAYETAATELESLLAEQERTEERILSLRKTMNVLSTLLQQGASDKSSPDYRYGRIEQILQSTLTDDIRSIMNASGGLPMTTSDVRDELNKLGHEMEKQSNPLATINAILNRLIEQGYVRETLKDGRKAWQRTAAQRLTTGQKVLIGLRKRGNKV